MFKCDCCGICCRHIRGITMLEAFDDGMGACIYLTAKRTCVQFTALGLWSAMLMRCTRHSSGTR